MESPAARRPAAPAGNVGLPRRVVKTHIEPESETRQDSDERGERRTRKPCQAPRSSGGAAALSSGPRQLRQGLLCLRQVGGDPECLPIGIGGGEGLTDPFVAAPEVIEDHRIPGAAGEKLLEVLQGGRKA